MKRLSQDVVAEIQRDREVNGLTLPQIVSKYGIPRSTAFYTIQNCTSANVVRKPRSIRVMNPVEHSARPLLSKTDLGEASRQMICARMMFNGIKVFRPITEDTAVDLLVLRENHSVAKCQCKYLYPGQNGCHVLKCSASGKGPERGKTRHIYTEDEVDFFLGFCLDDDAVYVVPRGATRGRENIHLWIMRNPIGRCSHDSYDAKSFKNAFDLLR
jgi:hypothetical protein